MLKSFLVPTGIVALAEIGDKTQLLSLVLSAKYRKPVPIILGVLTATLLNHAMAGGVGTLLSSVLNPHLLNWAIVISFLTMAFWIQVPDKLGNETVATKKSIFMTVAVSFFLAEMGDKTQIVTTALAAEFHDFASVVIGTTLGMMIANIPVILLGHRFADHLPVKTLHLVAAVIFIILGGMALRNALSC